MTFDDPTPSDLDFFGQALALDGNNVLIGVPGDDSSGNGVGQAHLFDATTGDLLQTFSDPTPTGRDQFGFSVALQGNLALIGQSRGVGEAHLFDATTGALIQTFSDPTPTGNDLFGFSVALDGGKALIGAPRHINQDGSLGQAHLYDVTTGALLKTFDDPTPTTVVGPRDRFGNSVAISGDSVLIGAPDDGTNGTQVGQAHLFSAATGNLLRTFDDPTITSNDSFGSSVSIEGDRALVGAVEDDTNGTNVGQAHLFDTTTGGLLRTFDDPTPTANRNDHFGASVALDAGKALIGAWGDSTNGTAQGQAHLFDAATGDLRQTFDDPTPTGADRFGFSVALDAGNALIGAWGDDTNGTNVGQAHLFQVGQTLDIVLDWATPIQTDYTALVDGATNEVSFVPTAGQRPALTVFDGVDPAAVLAFQEAVAERVRASFEFSGIEVNVINVFDPANAPLTPDEALTVRFGDPIFFDGDGDPNTPPDRMFGDAYDVASGPFSGIDRFNLRPGGEVAVFLQFENSDFPTLANLIEFTAETILHEAGHGLGLRHVNPASATAIMDYDNAFDDVELYTSTVSNIVEPPGPTGAVTDPPGTNGELGTHNPAYHLKRYSLGESDTGLAEQGILPGTWDDGANDIFTFSLEQVAGVGASLFNVTAQYGFGSGAFALDQDFTTLAFFDAVDLTTLADLEFLFDPEFPLRILASSQPGDVWDIFFGFGDPENPDLLFQDLIEGILDGLIYQFVDGGLNVIGTFSANIAFDSRVTPEGISFERPPPVGVPEPASALLFLIGLAGLGALARRRKRGCS